MPQPTLEGYVGQLVNDNLDLGCSVIERAATDKSVHDVDLMLKAAFAVRAEAKAAGQNFQQTMQQRQNASGQRFPGEQPLGALPNMV